MMEREGLAAAGSSHAVAKQHQQGSHLMTLGISPGAGVLPRRSEVSTEGPVHGAVVPGAGMNLSRGLFLPLVRPSRVSSWQRAVASRGALPYYCRTSVPVMLRVLCVSNY